MNYKTVQEIAIKWSMQPKEITFLCRNNKIEGAKKEGKFWLIPENACKPIDGRKRIDTTLRRPLPIGVDQYKEAVTRYYYVDKTLMIKDILDSQIKVSLFTRPRRFGKSLNMNMIQTFFEKTDEDTSIYFKDKAIWQEGERYTRHQGQYPVISLSFKDIKALNWNDSCCLLKLTFFEEFNRHIELLEGPATEGEKAYFKDVIYRKESIIDLSKAISTLSKMLYDYYHHDPIIIIDEYDTPIENSYIQGFYHEMISFMRNLFSDAFKDNRHCYFGFLTGILRVAKESIFSGLNNIKEYTILDDKYSQYFGFTHKEVKDMLKYYHRSLFYKEVCQWYDGYTFGHQEIFNPWSVVNYIDNDGFAKAYWANTSSNDVIKNMIRDSDDMMKEKLLSLMEGKSLPMSTDLTMSYPDMSYQRNAIFTLLLSAGYLKIVPNGDNDTVHFCEVIIPNKEVRDIYAQAIVTTLDISNFELTSFNIEKAIANNKMIDLMNFLQEYLTNAVSYYDGKHEEFYQGLMLGLYACMVKDYYIHSNREAGNGRYDIALEPRTKNRGGMIIELKVLKESKGLVKEELEALSRVALKQIKDKHYDASLKEKGITPIIGVGVAFYKKEVVLNSEIL